ncbi:copper transport protein ATOX1 isoform X1 [Pongo abelii]|uniref:Copper transport protein ATOX1 n=2 Tax=Pongo abelii TaxID=9601 RepID=A0A8I5TMM7_PONAB|nr:copper transport protein ATOX1 isoform X1 [Pongo abelii]
MKAESPGIMSRHNRFPSPDLLTRTYSFCKLQKHEFSVDMTCGGCAEAVSRVLNKLGGVKYDIDLPNKKVCIESEHSMDTLLATLKKTGKTVSYLGLK